MTTPAPRAVDPTWTWGSSAQLRLSRTFSGAAEVANTSAQLAQISLPEPAVCSLYLQASASFTSPQFTSVATFTINLNQGLGRVTVPRTIDFAGQPAEGAPLEFTLPFLPFHALNVDVSATANFDPDIPNTEIEINIFLIVAPITRIPQKIQQLQFGMALPGEADALDDELRENLEEDTPTVQAIMGREANVRVHGEPEEDDDEVEQVPAWMLDIVDRLTQRLKRTPTRRELRAAVARYRARAARRGG